MSGQLDVFSGPRALFDAARMSLFVPAVRRKVLGAFVLNSLLFCGVLAGLVWFAFWSTEGMMGGSWWFESLGWVLRVALCLALGFCTPMVFVVLGGLLLGPLGDVLFGAGRSAGGGSPDGSGQTPLSQALTGALGRLWRLLGWSLAILPLLLLPGIGFLLHGTLQFLLTGYFLGWELISLHFEHHGVDEDEARAFLKGNRMGVVSLGATATVLSLLPVVQLWFATTNLVGAGVLSARLDGRG